jgi:hypothetical protein
VKLHRMVLTNYRGIAHREVHFPDRGVVVVSGANEIGKSSMIEALDMLLEVKDRSTKREVKDVKPTHADVGAEVTAEISTGPYRFVYRKRFHKGAQTELTVLAPTRQQLTGDEAHERVLAILAETVDMDLWRAQRILQSSATGPVDLSGSDALSRALDAAAGQAVTLSGTEPLVVDQIDLEYRKYFTATGRPTSEWLAATRRLQQSTARVAECQAAVDEVDGAVVRHGELADRLGPLALERSSAAQRLEAADAAAAAVASLRGRLEQTRTLAEAFTAAHAAAVEKTAHRTRQVGALETLVRTIADLDNDVAAATGDHRAAQTAATTALATAGTSRATAEVAEAAVRDARAAVDAIARRDESTRLATRIGKLDAARAALAEADRTLAAGTLTAATVKNIETAQAVVAIAAAKVESLSARVEVTAAADITLDVAGSAVELGAGEVHSVALSSDTAVDVPGVVRVRIIPSESAADSQATYEAATEHLAALLAAAGVADVDAARAERDRLQALALERDRLRATCDGLLADDDLEVLRNRVADLRDTAAVEGDADTARKDLESAVTVHRAAAEQANSRRADADKAIAVVAAATTRLSVVSEKLTAAREQLSTGTAELAAQRAVVTDEELAKTTADAFERAADAVAQAQALATELAVLVPEAVAAEHAEAVRAATAAAAAHDAVGEELRDVAAQLKVYGGEGRKGRLDEAEAELEHAAAEHARLRRRSGAADLLRSVMGRHRDASRERYVEPFRREVERLGRIVFGDDFEVEIDGTLRILSRTLNGCTVPYESLSGGAREQLGIVARLAGSALVAKEDGVPVVIDDALGFTDAVRLAKMGEVFDAVGGDGQVIVLTCAPDRYAAVGEAEHVELTA